MSKKFLVVLFGGFLLKHEYSTIALFFLLFIAVVTFLAVGLEVGDESECPQGFGLITNNSLWVCWNFSYVDVPIIPPFTETILYQNLWGNTSGWSCDAGVVVSNSSSRLSIVGTLSADKTCRMNLPYVITDGQYRFEYLLNSSSVNSVEIFGWFNPASANIYSSGIGVGVDYENTRWRIQQDILLNTDPVNNSIYKIVQYVNLTGVCNFNLSIYDVSGAVSIYSNSSYRNCQVPAENLGALGIYHFRTSGSWIFDDIKIYNVTK